MSVTDILSAFLPATKDQTVPNSTAWQRDLGSTMTELGLNATVELLYEDPLQQGCLEESLYRRMEEEDAGLSDEVLPDEQDHVDLSNDVSPPICSWPNIYAQCTETSMTEMTRDMQQPPEMDPPTMTHTDIPNHPQPAVCQTAQSLFNDIQRPCAESLSDSCSVFNDLEEDNLLFPELFGRTMQCCSPSSPPLSSDGDLDLVLDLILESATPSLTNATVEPCSSSAFTLDVEAMESSPIFENNASAAVPKLSLLLGENHQMATILSPEVQNLGYTVARSGPSSTGDDEESLSASDTSDDDYTPNNLRKQMIPILRPRVQKYTTGKRSRRKSPKLWVFLLDSLCDPKLNPSVIRWENKNRGIFKIADTKQMADIWGRRCKGPGTSGKHNMNYEKLSRAIRYYYKPQVINSVNGRLTYQFGPNATGWRAQASSAIF